MAKEILCAYGVDVDAVAGWLGSYGGEDSPCDISPRHVRGRGRLAAAAAPVRALRHQDHLVHPGHSIETFPEQMKAVADAGHEIGMHGYSHENPIAMTPEQEEAIFDKCIEVITELARQAAARLRRAVVGVRRQDQRAAARRRASSTTTR